MNIKVYKHFSILAILILIFSMFSCNKIDDTDTLDESKINLSRVLQYKNSHIGDNTAITSIIKNLPGNNYNEGIELQTSTEPYGITVYYKKFDKISIRLDNNSKVTSSFDDITKKNALILFALIPNAQFVNFKTDDAAASTAYTRNNLEKEYSANGIKNIIKDKSSLESLILN